MPSSAQNRCHPWTAATTRAVDDAASGAPSAPLRSAVTNARTSASATSDGASRPRPRRKSA